MRNIQATVTGIYGAAAAFEETALELFGRKDVSESRRRCQDLDHDLFAQHRQVTLAYSTVWHLITFIPTVAKEIRELAVDVFKMDLDICESQDHDCTDITTPWGMAHLMLQDSIEIFSKDGWNVDGNYTAEFDKLPFSDWRSNPYMPNPKCKNCWQPLQESNNLGFFFRQEHVVPHIGETATSFFLGDEDVCSRTIDDPGYDYAAEAAILLERSATLDDYKKAEVEFFDSKLTSILPFQVQYFVRQGISLDSFDFIFTDTITIATIQEAVIVGWKEKVRHDRIRPTTWIHRNFGDETVTAYAGAGVAGTGEIPANEWHPYIRTMPHAEYPSGSSCMCSAFSRAMIAITGKNDVTATLGSPLAERITAGSSSYEKGRPKKDVVLAYESWTDIADACGISRLNGGMHFTASVAAGEELCASIGDKVYEYFVSLKDGETPATAVDVKNMMPRMSRGCPTGGRGGN